MFRIFSGAAAQGWPRDKVVGALETQYGNLDKLGEEGPLSVYGVQENGVNFVVAIMETGPGSGRIAELGFLARFVGFDLDSRLVETINRSLHISVASIESGGDLFLMAGLQPAGAFDHGQFTMMLESWRRDLMVTLHGLSNQMSFAAAFPAARLEAARNFAVNVAPAPSAGMPVDLLASYLGAKSMREVCGECSGRGKRGFIARVCGVCEGSGFVKPR
jgi:hypothetical protein